MNVSKVTQGFQLGIDAVAVSVGAYCHTPFMLGAYGNTPYVERAYGNTPYVERAYGNTPYVERAYSNTPLRRIINTTTHPLLVRCNA